MGLGHGKLKRGGTRRLDRGRRVRWHELPADRLVKRVREDPVDMEGRLERTPQGDRVVEHRLDVGRPQLGESDIADGRKDMVPEDLLVPPPGPRPNAGALVVQPVGGWPGASQPPAPTDPGVTVSRHRALLTSRSELGLWHVPSIPPGAGAPVDRTEHPW